jgi:hypothetical protein
LSIRSKENKRETWPFSHGVIPLLILAKSDNFMHRYMDYMIVKSDNMKATTVFKLLALTLIFVFIIGPTTAATSGQEALIAGYIKSSMSTSFGISPIKPSTYNGINLSPDAYPKPAWVASEKFCSACALKNVTNGENSVLMGDYASVLNKQYSKQFTGFFFGSAAGAPAGGGGGCCG